MSTLDQVVLVNEHDQEVGVMDVLEAHRGEGRLHRAVSVYLFRQQVGGIEMLMQQRSPQKIVGGTQWANTVCGNVRPGETPEQCAYRRLREELAITQVEIDPIYKFRYQVQCNAEFSENEIDRVFYGWYDSGVDPNPVEVARVEWVSWEYLKRHVASGAMNGKTPAPWFEIMLKDRELVERLDAALQAER